MYIYKLLNFKSKTFLFSEDGDLVYDYSYQISHHHDHDCYCVSYYDFEYKCKKQMYTDIEIKKLNFNDIPNEIKGLFVLYYANMHEIKNSISKQQLQLILNEYGEKL